MDFIVGLLGDIFADVVALADGFVGLFDAREEGSFVGLGIFFLDAGVVVGALVFGGFELRFFDLLGLFLLVFLDLFFKFWALLDLFDDLVPLFCLGFIRVTEFYLEIAELFFVLQFLGGLESEGVDFFLLLES